MENLSFSCSNLQVCNIAVINYSLSFQSKAVQNKGINYFLSGGNVLEVKTQLIAHMRHLHDYHN